MKTDTKKEKKNGKPFTGKKILLIGLCIALGITVAILLILVFADAYEFTHPNKVSAIRFPDDGDIGLYYESKTVTFDSGKDTVLWYIPAQNTETAEKENSDITVIFSHDYEDNKTVTKIEDGVLYAKDLAGNGINVVMFDFSGSGIATGSGYTFGERESDELRQIVNFVADNYADKYIILQGWGFGASAAILAGAGNEKVSAVIADSAYTSLDTYFNTDGGFSKWSALPGFLSDISKALVPVFSDGDIYAANPLKAIENMSGQTYFFISEKLDTVFGTEYSKQLNSAAISSGNTSTLWESEVSYHAQAFRDDRTNYTEKIITFINNLTETKE